MTMILFLIIFVVLIIVPAVWLFIDYRFGKEKQSDQKVEK